MLDFMPLNTISLCIALFDINIIRIFKISKVNSSNSMQEIFFKVMHRFKPINIFSHAVHGTYAASFHLHLVVFLCIKRTAASPHMPALPALMSLRKIGGFMVKRQRESGTGRVGRGGGKRKAKRLLAGGETESLGADTKKKNYGRKRDCLTHWVDSIMFCKRECIVLL